MIKKPSAGSGKNKAVNYRRLHVLVVIFGLLISLTAFTLVRNWDRQTAHVRYQSLVNASLAVFNSKLQAYFSELGTLGQFFTNSTHVSPDEFAGFTRAHFKRFPSIEAIMWAPVVAGAERVLFESRHKLLGGRKYLIHDHAPWELHRDVKIATEREKYFPVLYVEPYEKEGYSLGYDLGSSHELRTMLDRALATNSPQFGVRRLELADEKDISMHGFILQKIETPVSYVSPGIRGDAPSAGFLVMRIDFAVAMNLAAELAQASDIEVSIFDDSQAEGKRLVFTTVGTADDSAGERKNVPVYGLLDNFDFIQSLPLLGPQWRIAFVPTRDYLRQNFSWYPWLILLLGLVVTVWLMVLVGFWQRRTERMQIAMDEGSAALAKSRQRHEAILQTVAEGIITIDRQGLINSFNRAAEEIFDYRADEVMGQNVSILLPKKDRQEHEGYTLNSRLHEPRVINKARDLVGCRKDGSLFPLELNVAPFETPEGEGFVGVLRDITERKRAEEELIDQKEQLSDILENTDDGYLQIDWMWRVTYINPRAEELLAIRRQDVLNNDLREVMPDVVSMFYKALRNTLVDRRHQQVVVLYGPTQRYLESNSTPTKDGLIVYFRDVSQQKHVEEELINAKEVAENASRAKSQYLSRMSHELRTPMNAVLGFGQLLEMDDSLNEAQRVNVKEIMKAGRHLLDLIDEVLDLSRIEAGKYGFKFTRVNIGELTEESIALVSDMARKHGIEIDNRITGICNEHLLLDAKAFKQILINLLSNAIKYNEKGGSVRLVCEKLEDQATHSENLRVSVSDTGPGIDEEHHERLFDPFERLGKEREVEGTGVGLSVVKGLVEGMGGSIGVESQSGQGCTFWVEFSLGNKP